jgi:hypothetical protein
MRRCYKTIKSTIINVHSNRKEIAFSFQEWNKSDSRQEKGFEPTELARNKRDVPIPKDYFRRLSPGGL